MLIKENTFLSGMVSKITALKKTSPSIQKLTCMTNIHKDQRLPSQNEVGQTEGTIRLKWENIHRN
jgi:hypothetical protein